MGNTTSSNRHNIKLGNENVNNSIIDIDIVNNTVNRKESDNSSKYFMATSLKPINIKGQRERKK